MCREASFVLTKTKVYWSRTSDSHEEIIAEHKLNESGTRGVNILRVEIVPPHNDYSIPARKWVFGFDQDLLPKWANKEKDEKRVRRELAKWIKAKVILPGKTIDNLQGCCAYLYGTVQNVKDGGTVQNVRDGGTVQNVGDGGTVQNVKDGGTVQNVRDGGTVQNVRNGGTKYIPAKQRENDPPCNRGG